MASKVKKLNIFVEHAVSIMIPKVLPHANWAQYELYFVYFVGRNECVTFTALTYRVFQPLSHLANFLNYWNEAFVPSHELATICCNMLPYHHHSHKNVIEMCINSFFFWSVFNTVFKIFPNKIITKQQKHCPKANHWLRHYESNPRFQISYLTLKCQVSHPNFQIYFNILYLLMYAILALR